MQDKNKAIQLLDESDSIIFGFRKGSKMSDGPHDFAIYVSTELLKEIGKLNTGRQSMPKYSDSPVGRSWGINIIASPVVVVWGASTMCAEYNVFLPTKEFEESCRSKFSDAGVPLDPQELLCEVKGDFRDFVDAITYVNTSDLTLALAYFAIQPYESVIVSDERVCLPLKLLTLLEQGLSSSVMFLGEPLSKSWWGTQCSETHVASTNKTALTSNEARLTLVNAIKNCRLSALQKVLLFIAEHPACVRVVGDCVLLSITLLELFDDSTYIKFLGERLSCGWGYVEFADNPEIDNADFIGLDKQYYRYRRQSNTIPTSKKARKLLARMLWIAELDRVIPISDI